MSTLCFSIDRELFEGTFHPEQIVVSFGFAGTPGLVGFDVLLVLEPILVGH